MLLTISDELCQVKSCCCEVGWLVGDHGVVQQALLQHKLGHRMLQQIHITSLGESAEEIKRDWAAQVKVQGAEDSQLHVPDLLAGVGVVSDVDKVRNLGSKDLFHLGSEEHGGHSHQLQLGPVDGLAFLGEVPVNYRNGHEERLLQEPELLLDLHQPVHQHGPHLASDGAAS